jgi:hypothetical protein
MVASDMVAKASTNSNQPGGTKEFRRLIDDAPHGQSAGTPTLERKQVGRSPLLHVDKVLGDVNGIFKGVHLVK